MALPKNKMRSFAKLLKDNPEINVCLRCGYRWRSNKIMGEAALFPPVRCARCRSPLWNTPRVNKQPSKEAKEILRTIETDRDGYERLYRTEKRRREEAEAEAARYKKLWEDQERAIQQQFDELVKAQRFIKYLQGRRK